LDEDFEKLFTDVSYVQLIKEAYDRYGDNKVLHGTYLTLQTPIDKIPKPIREIIDQLKSLEVTNSY
jgi:hypothetical protein